MHFSICCSCLHFTFYHYVLAISGAFLQHFVFRVLSNVIDPCFDGSDACSCNQCLSCLSLGLSPIIGRNSQCYLTYLSVVQFMKGLALVFSLFDCFPMFLLTVHPFVSSCWYFSSFVQDISFHIHQAPFTFFPAGVAFGCWTWDGNFRALWGIRLSLYVH